MIEEDPPLPRRILDTELTQVSAGVAHSIIDEGGLAHHPVEFNPKHVTTPLERELIEERARNAATQVELINNANTDSLTGLGSREKLNNDMQAAYDAFQQTGVPFGVAEVDLDNFKAINDIFGHGAGDEFLRGIGDGLRHRSRQDDEFYRKGGDEFSAIMRFGSNDSDRKPPEDMRQAEDAISARYEEVVNAVTGALVKKHGYDPAMYIGASVGFAIIKPGESLDHFRHRVDEIMYRNKMERNKRNELANGGRIGRRENPAAIRAIRKERFGE